MLDLLTALTEADGRATGPAAWSPWRAGLVSRLAAAAAARLGGAPLPDPLPLQTQLRRRAREVAGRLDGGEPVVVLAPERGLPADPAGTTTGTLGPPGSQDRSEVEQVPAATPGAAAQDRAVPDRAAADRAVPDRAVPDRAVPDELPAPDRSGGPSVPAPSAWTITVFAPDRPGLLALVAGVLTSDRFSVRSATSVVEAGVAAIECVVARRPEDPPDLPRLRLLLGRALAGRLDLAGRLASRETALPAPVAAPRVTVAQGASAQATVLEVRAADRAGLLFRVCLTISDAGGQMRSAHASTLGGEAVDVFYVVDTDGSCRSATTRPRSLAVVGVRWHWPREVRPPVLPIAP